MYESLWTQVSDTFQNKALMRVIAPDGLVTRLRNYDINYDNPPPITVFTANCDSDNPKSQRCIFFGEPNEEDWVHRNPSEYFVILLNPGSVDAFNVGGACIEGEENIVTQTLSNLLKPENRVLTEG